MPEDKLREVLLAKKVLAQALGDETTVPVSGFEKSAYWIDRIPKVYPKTNVLERIIPTGLIAKSKLFRNPFPESQRPSENQEVLAALKQVQKEHPHAVSQIENLYLEPQPAGHLGNKAVGGVLIDPTQAREFNPTDSPVNNLTDVLKHELSHVTGYFDDYSAQPIIKDKQGRDVYGRRPLSAVGVRDSQDVDVAAHLLHKKDR